MHMHVTIYISRNPTIPCVVPSRAVPLHTRRRRLQIRQDPGLSVGHHTPLRHWLFNVRHHLVCVRWQSPRSEDGRAAAADGDATVAGMPAGRTRARSNTAASSITARSVSEDSRSKARPITHDGPAGARSSWRARGYSNGPSSPPPPEVSSRHGRGY